MRVQPVLFTDNQKGLLRSVSKDLEHALRIAFYYAPFLFFSNAFCLNARPMGVDRWRGYSDKIQGATLHSENTCQTRR
jgi:hypothetical protein